MGRIGRRHKGKKMGSYDYVKKKRTLSNSQPTSPKRQRIAYKRQGSEIKIPDINAVPPASSQHVKVKKTSFQYAVYYYYVEWLDAPPKEQWKGRDGTIHQIRRKLELPRSARLKIERVLENILCCICDGHDFEGKFFMYTGRPLAIEEGSVEEELIAKWMESHLGFRMTTLLVNEHRKEEGKERVSVSAVMNAFYRLNPKVSIIEKVQSGGNNKGWIEASYNVSKQMQIMMGKLTDNEIMTDHNGKQ